MNPDPPEALAEIEELCSLVKTGQLFAVQKWLAEGKSHRLPTTELPSISETDPPVGLSR